MINIRPLIEAQLVAQTTGFNEISGASDLQSILVNRFADPGCYVFQERISVNKNTSTSKVIQQIDAIYAAVIVIRNVKDSRGTDAADAGFVLQTDVMTALLNWKPHTEYTPLEYSGGSLVYFSNGFYVWKDSYKTSTQIQS